MKFNWKRKTYYQKIGACSLVFDDGYKETLVNVLPLLKKYNLRATFALATNPEMIQQNKEFPCADPKIAKRLGALGHEIASHTQSHQNLTQCSSSELEKELGESQKIFSAQTIIYPGGVYNKKVIQAAEKYYQFGRGVKEGLNNIPPQNFLTLKSYVLRQNTKWFFLNWKARQAHYHNKWLLESYHLVSDRKTNYRFTVRPRDLEKHLQKLLSLNLWIAPLGVVGNYIQDKLRTEKIK